MSVGFAQVPDGDDWSRISAAAVTSEYRHIALAQAREAASTFLTFMVTDVGHREVARRIVGMAQVFEHYLSTGGVLDDGQAPE